MSANSSTTLTARTTVAQLLAEYPGLATAKTNTADVTSVRGFKKAPFAKFGTNPWGIVNSKGETVTVEYLRRYVACWCRKSEGFTHNREANMNVLTSDMWFEACAGFTASQVGHLAAIDPCWIVDGVAPKPVAGGKPATKAEIVAEATPVAAPAPEPAPAVVERALTAPVARTRTSKVRWNR